MRCCGGFSDALDFEVVYIVEGVGIQQRINLELMERLQPVHGGQAAPAGSTA